MRKKSIGDCFLACRVDRWFTSSPRRRWRLVKHCATTSKSTSGRCSQMQKRLAAELQEQGLRLVSGGTDNHLMLVDVWMDGKGITGKDAEKALEAANITVNKNTIPFDQNKPFVASGLRIGTPAVTTRGMKEAEMREIGQLIAEVIHAPASEEVRAKVRQGVTELSSRFPLYAKRLKRQPAQWALKGKRPQTVEHEAKTADCCF